MNDNLGCHDCGRRYNSAGWVETSIPDDIWAEIAPRPDGGGVLCPGCMSARLDHMGHKQQSVPCVFVGTSPLKSCEALPLPPSEDSDPLKGWPWLTITPEQMKILGGVKMNAVMQAWFNEALAQRRDVVQQVELRDVTILSLREENESLRRLIPKRQNLRNKVYEWTPAERAICDAQQAVELAGASTALTDASTLLSYARDKVAEHVLALSAPVPETET